LCVTAQLSVSLEDQPNGLKMIPALRLLQSQFIVSPVLYDEDGNNVITHSVVLHRKISHKIVLQQEVAIMFS